jgi:hypothetical protein
LRDITATVIFDEYFAFGSIRVAGNSRKQQSNQQRPLRSLHGDSKLKVAVEMRSLYWAFIGRLLDPLNVLPKCNQRETCWQYKHSQQHGERHENIPNCNQYDYSCHWRQWMRWQRPDWKR